MSHVLLNKINKPLMLRTLKSRRYLSMAFHLWDLYEFPFLQSTTKHSWAINQLEKTHYIIFVMQTGRKTIISDDINRFDCKLIMRNSI